MKALVRGELKLESSRTHLFYDRKSGVIVHAHTTDTFAGAAARSAEAEGAHAKEMARYLGLPMERLEVLRADDYDAGKLWRVDVKTRRLVPDEPKKKKAGKRKKVRRK